jgi:hypothetical protein
MVSSGRSTPLVEPDSIFAYRTAERRPDQAGMLARWRQLLRQHFRR